MAATLTREQQLRTWQSLQAALKDVPLDWIDIDDVAGLSDDALQARIDTQQANIDANAGAGPAVRAPVDLNAEYEPLEDDADIPAAPAGLRAQAIKTLKTPDVSSPADMAYFHALLGAYSASQSYTVPDLAFDDVITEAEQKAANDIATRLEAGENAPQIEQAFDAAGATLAEQERLAQIAEQERLAREAAAARQQGNLETAVDSHLAAAGYIKPELIGELTDEQRANVLKQFAIEHAEVLRAQGTETFQMSESLTGQLQKSFKDDIIVGDKALSVLTVGRQGEAMADEVETWLESGDPKQIMMAQATIGVQVTGAIDNATYTAGNMYIAAPYATSLDELNFIENANGSINPTLMSIAANEGKIYMPTLDELRAAGVSDAVLESIEAAQPASELLSARAALKGRDLSTFNEEERKVWVSDTREELIASQFRENPDLYKQIVEGRNELAKTHTLDVTVATPQAEQAAFNDLYDSIPDALVEGDGARVILASTGEAIDDVPPGVRELITARASVERAEQAYNEVNMQVGGMRTDPETGKEYYYDVGQERMKAEDVLEEAQNGYMAIEDGLKADGTYGEAVAYLKAIQNGETPPRTLIADQGDDPIVTGTVETDGASLDADEVPIASPTGFNAGMIGAESSLWDNTVTEGGLNEFYPSDYQGTMAMFDENGQFLGSFVKQSDVAEGHQPNTEMNFTQAVEARLAESAASKDPTVTVANNGDKPILGF